MDCEQRWVAETVDEGPDYQTPDRSAHPDEFEPLWLQHRQAIFQRCLRLMAGRRDDAEEAFSRASLVAFQKYPSHRSAIRDVLPWLFGLTRNVCMDLYRERIRERRLTPLRDSSPEGLVDLERADPEARLQARELAVVVRAGVARLPRRLRFAVELRLSGSLCDREIADTLDITEASVRKRLQDARTALRPLLRAYLDGQSLPPRPADSAGEDGLVHLRWARRSISVGLASGALRTLPLLLPYPVPRTGGRGLAALQDYLRSHPSGWRKRFALALALAADSRVAEAIGHLLQVVERRPQALEAWLTLVRLLLACGRDDAAREAACRAVAAVRPSGGRREWLRGVAAGHAGEAALAAATLARPRDPGPWLSLAELHLRDGRPEPALAAIEAALSAGGEQPAALAMGFDPLWAASRQGAAVERLERALQLDPGDIGTLARVAALRARPWPEPPDSPLLRRLAASASPEACEALALHDLQHARQAQARRRTSELCRSLPAHAGAWLAAGRLQVALSEFDSAVASLREAIRLAPQERAAYVELCRALSCTAALDAGRRAAATALERFPNDWWVVTGVAAAMADAGEPPPSLLAAAQGLVQRDAGLPASWFCLGRLLARMREGTAAITALLAGWQRLPAGDGYLDSAPAALCLAGLYLARSDVARARVWYQTAAEHAEKLKALDIAVAEECARRSSAALEGLGASLTAEAPGTAGPWSPRHDPAAGRTGFPLPPRQLERMLRPEGPGDRTLDSSTGYRRKQP